MGTYPQPTVISTTRAIQNYPSPAAIKFENAQLFFLLQLHFKRIAANRNALEIIFMLAYRTQRDPKYQHLQPCEWQDQPRTRQKEPHGDRRQQEENGNKKEHPVTRG